jgi:hypothetical protein
VPLGVSESPVEAEFRALFPSGIYARPVRAVGEAEFGLRGRLVLVLVDLLARAASGEFLTMQPPLS